MACPLTTTEISALAQLSKTAGGSPLARTPKGEFKRLGRKLMRGIVEDLGLPDGTYEIRFNPGGSAVTGETTLHGDHLYVMAGWDMSGFGIMYRSCEGRKDYSGGINQWWPYMALQNWDGFISALQATNQAGAPHV